ncbi:MAG: Holliday junction resolvase RuvX [Pseudomonadota bacterium]|nr:Holliday junction resolvase RuvX [Pseudomonadota bacterium]
MPEAFPHIVPAGAPPKVIIAFDFGRRRIGVACADTISRTARPVAAIANTAAGPDWARVDATIRAWQPGLLVVGLPLNVDGSESPLAAAVRSFAAALAGRAALPVDLIDERYSSLDAAARLAANRASGLRTRRVRKEDVDAMAACIILERWLHQSPSETHALTAG